MNAPAVSRGEAWTRFARHRVAVAATVVALCLVALALAAPAVSPHAPQSLDWEATGVSPTLARSHWLGTDRLGRDLFARTLAGLRISLLIGLAASAVSLVIGVTWGAVAGYIGGRVDAAMMRIVDILSALPYVFFVILLTVALGREPWLLFVAIGAVGWLTTARVIRGHAMALRRREFVTAAIVAGATPGRIVVRHLLPNLAGTIAVYATLAIPQMILAESFLSFLGLGIQEPLASLGNLVADGAVEMETAPWMLLVPGGVLATLVLCLNFIGDGLRDALDPRAD